VPGIRTSISTGVLALWAFGALLLGAAVLRLRDA